MNLCAAAQQGARAFLNSRAGDRERQWHQHMQNRAPSEARMLATIQRHLDYAKSEMLRNIERHYHADAAMANALYSDSTGVMFDKGDFTRGLVIALNAEYPSIFETAGDQLFDELSDEIDTPDTQTPSEAVKAFMATRENLLSGASDEIWNDVRAAYLQGRAQHLTMAELRHKIQDAFQGISEGRASNIATTETGAAYGTARHIGMKQAGVLFHTWLCTFDNSREWHEDADGQKRPIDEPFLVKDEKMMHPGDVTASAANVCNCRCIELPSME